MFRSLLERTKQQDIIEGLDKEDAWQKFEEEDNYAEAFTVLTK